MRRRQRRPRGHRVHAEPFSRVDVDPRCDQVGIRGRRLATGGWTARAIGVHRVVEIGCTYREGFGIVGRADARRRTGPVVSGSEHRHDSRGAQRLEIGPKLEIAARCAVRPRVVDDLRSIGRRRISIRVQDPLQGTVNRCCSCSTGIVEHTPGDPGCSGSDADCGPTGLAADDDPHRLSAMPRQISWRCMLAVRIEPRVGTTAIRGSEVGVRDIYSGVQTGNHHTLPVVPLGPNRGGVDLGNVRLRRCDRRRSLHDVDRVRGDALHVRPGGQLSNDVRSRSDRHAVEHPERLVLGDTVLRTTAVEIRTQRNLSDVGRLAQIIDRCPLTLGAGAMCSACQRRLRPKSNDHRQLTIRWCIGERARQVGRDGAGRAWLRRATARGCNRGDTHDGRHDQEHCAQSLEHDVGAYFWTTMCSRRTPLITIDTSEPWCTAFAELV